MTDKLKRLYEITMNLTSATNGTPYVSPSVSWLISELKTAWKQNEELVAALDMICTHSPALTADLASERKLNSMCEKALAKLRGEKLI